MRAGLWLALVLGTACIFRSDAQGVFVPTGSETYHLFDRAEIKSGVIAAELHSAHKPYNRQQIAEFLQNLNDSEINWSPCDRFNLQYLSRDNYEWTNDSTVYNSFPLFRYAYSEKPFFLSYYDDDFSIFANPVLDVNAGTTSGLPGSKSIYTNTRGFEVRGQVNQRIGFYSLVTENQARLPYYVDDYVLNRFDSVQSLPGVGFLKTFGVNGYDYLLARGYFTFKATRSIHLQFGHDRNFVGNGIRSMILSDFAREYLFLKVNTQVWKLNYQNLFMELFNGGSFTGGSNIVGKKYAAQHHLSMNVARNFNIGLSETIIFSRNDSTGRGFELNYLNPVIFYRSVEQNLNSSDNAMLSLDLKWNFLEHFSFYGQCMLDEFVLHELRSGNGWWANKYGAQAGIKYIDVAGISNLDLQVEGNLARPYTYTHKKVSQNYAHYGQPLAHPLGANFSELITQVRYQPLNRLNLRAMVSYSMNGLDSGAYNYGSDPFKSYQTRTIIDHGSHIGMGDKTTVVYAEFYASWMAFHNLFVWTTVSMRKATSLTGQHDADEKWVSLGIRLNFPQKQFLF